MTERDAPSADAVKLVDEALCARAVFAQDAFSARDTRISHSRLVAARAALLDHIAAKGAEIERLKAEVDTAVLNRNYYAEQRKQAEAELAAKAAPAPERRYRGTVWTDEQEQAAKKVYENFSGFLGYVPWVDRGNSDKQNEARDLVWHTTTVPAEGEQT